MAYWRMKNELMPEPDEITLDKISQYSTRTKRRANILNRSLAEWRGLPALQK